MSSHLKNLISYHDAPVSTISYLVHSLLSKKISEDGYKVSISGTGADELLTGYYDHYNLQLYNLKDSIFYQNKLKDWRKYISPIVRNPFLKNPNLYIDNPSSREHIYLDNHIFSKFLNKNFKESFVEHFYSENLLHNRMMNELFHEGSRVVLNQDDLNSMLYSVENRSPYLDRSLAEFSYSIPTHLLIQDGYGKFILRESVKNILNDKVRLDRQKKGFNASINTIFDFKEKKLKEELLEDSDFFQLVNKSEFKILMNKRKLKNSENKLLFSLINVKYFIDGQNEH